MATWSKIEILTENGTNVMAQAPMIISASRSTDIPAFYSDWFFHRLRTGYSAWTNPFNGVKNYVSYQNVRFIVFWSKNPKPLLKYIPYLKERNIKCYIQYTLNDYENEQLEKVPSLQNRIKTFKELSNLLGKNGVVWRFDPMILTDKISIEKLLNKVQNIGDQLKDYTEKLVFSYADIEAYKKVKKNLITNGIHYQEWTEPLMYEFARKLSTMNKERNWGFTLATCGEKINIAKFGIQHNRCIDSDLIAKIAWDDNVLMKFMGIKIQNMPVPDIFGNHIVLPENAIILPGHKYFVSNHKKDPGQRPLCGCMAAKDIGEYNTCPHLCEYCYANVSKELALNNWKRHQDSPYAETITGR